MEKEIKAVLLLDDDTEVVEELTGYFKDKKIQLVTARKMQEARLKFENQSFSFIIMNMDIEGFVAKDFVLKTRQKSVGSKSMDNNVPTLLTSEDYDNYQSNFTDIENTYFLARPFSLTDFDKKYTSVIHHSKLQKAGTKQIKEGELLIVEGDSNNCMYWVISGSFSIVKKNADNEYVDIGEAQTGELLGEMSFLDKLPRSASVIAREDSEVLEIPHKKFVDLLDSQPRWFRSLIQTLSMRLRDTTQKLSDN